MKSLRRLLKLFLHQLRAFGLLMIALVALPIFAGWVGDLIKEWIESPTNISAGDVWLFAVGLIGLILFLIVALREGKRLIRPRVIEQTTTVAPHKVVIAMLSPCTNLEREWCEGIAMAGQAVPKFRKSVARRSHIG